MGFFWSNFNVLEKSNHLIWKDERTVCLEYSKTGGFVNTFKLAHILYEFFNVQIDKREHTFSLATDIHERGVGSGKEWNIPKML